MWISKRYRILLKSGAHQFAPALADEAAYISMSLVKLLSFFRLCRSLVPLKKRMVRLDCQISDYLRCALGNLLYSTFLTRTRPHQKRNPENSEYLEVQKHASHLLFRSLASNRVFSRGTGPRFCDKKHAVRGSMNNICTCNAPRSTRLLPVPTNSLHQCYKC